MTLSDSHPYGALWSKYRPVVLQLLTQSEKGPQHYKLFSHEFKAVGVKEKSGFSFKLEIQNGSIVNSHKTGLVAKDLFQVLQQSRRGLELISQGSYELSLDRNFNFHVQRNDAPTEEPVAAEAEQVPA